MQVAKEDVHPLYVTRPQNSAIIQNNRALYINELLYEIHTTPHQQPETSTKVPSHHTHPIMNSRRSTLHPRAFVAFPAETESRILQDCGHSPLQHGLHDGFTIHNRKSNSFTTLINVLLREYQGAIFGQEISKHASENAAVISYRQKKVRRM